MLLESLALTEGASAGSLADRHLLAEKQTSAGILPINSTISPTAIITQMQYFTRAQGHSTTLERPSVQNGASSPQMLVFIDPRLENVQMLALGVQPGAEVILLDPHQDGVEQVTQALSGRTISSVHLVAHGSPGYLQLGASELSLDNLDRYADQLQTWSNSLGDSSLLIYGCQVAAGRSGANFLQRLHQLTQAHIAASTDKVGSQEQGGSWQLGYQIGQVNSELAFLPSVRAVYPSVFISYNEATDGDISDNRSAPLSLGLEEGTNSLTATSAEGDIEYITVNVPDGFQLDSLILESYSSSDARAFAAVQSGSVFTEPPEGTDVGNLLGYGHIGPDLDQVGTDILDDLGNGQGAIGFTSPLSSGDYTFWLQQTGNPATYTLDFNVSTTNGGGNGGTAPTVSLQAIAGTFDSADNLLAPALVQSLEDGASLLTLAFNVEGEIPEEGLVVTVNSDIALLDYFADLGFTPFSPGGEVLEGVYDPETGEGTGFRFRIDEANAIINLPVLDDGEADGPTQATFTLEAGEGYTVNPEVSASTVTFYDTVEDVPAPTVVPEVSFTASNTALVESEGTQTTISFSLSEPPPEEGVLVYVDSGVGGAVGEFDVLNAEVTGGVFPASNFSSSGFYFKILEQEASITLSTFPDDINEEGETVTEGIEAFPFSLQAGPGYTVNPEASSVNLTIADTPESQIQVGLTTSPDTLIESEATVSVHTFSLSAPPPEEGVTVFVSTSSLGEFNLEGVEVTGGTIAEVTNEGFFLNITQQEAVINLPVAEDGENEGLEEATFTLEAGEGYQINPDASSGTFNLVDAPEQVPPPTEVSEPNDIIDLALDTRLSDLNPTFSINSSIDFDFDNQYEVEDGQLWIDFTEDVDLYKFDLQTGDTVRIDTDAGQIDLESPSELDSVLRLFDAEGNPLVQSDDNNAPNEVFVASVDSYIEYTAEADGTYYAGVSSFPNGEFDFFEENENRPYDPLTLGSGTGGSSGEYALNLSLNTELVPEPTVINPGTGEGPTVSLQSTPGTFDANDNLLASSLVESIEDGASLLTLGFQVEGAIPEEGLEVFLNSDINLGDYFDIGGQPFSPGGEVIGAVYDEAGNPSGIRFRLDEANAIINLAVENQEEPEDDGPEQATFSLEASEGYTVSEDTSSTTVTLYDTLEDVPEIPTVPEVGIAVSETELIESEGNETTISFSLSEPPPEDGVLVYVDSGIEGALGEFDVLNAEIAGGALPAPNFSSSGFYFRITEPTASITLSAFDETTIPDIDPEEATEGIEDFTFTLQPGTGYAIDPDASAFSLTIADNPDSVELPDDGDGDGDGEEPATVEPNDILSEAIATNLSAENAVFSTSGEINSSDETGDLIDASEDVDFYSFDLNAGDTVTIDVDSSEYELEGFDVPQRLDSELRLFNEAGEELAISFDNAALDELFVASGDPYLEFTAEEAGTYSVGVAQLGNSLYDPSTAGSGSGWIFPDFGINVGEYDLEIGLTPNNVDPTEPVVSFEAIPANVSEEEPDATVTWQWTVEGDFPEEGLVVSLDTLGENDVIEFTEQFAADREVEFIDSEIVDFDEATGRLSIELSQPNASFVLPIINDIIEEGAQTFDFRLADGDGYTVDPEQNSTLLTITDDNGGPGVGTAVGISTSDADLIEGEEFTVNFTVDGDIPDEGVTILVESPVPGALGEFDIDGIDPATDITGTNGKFPEVGDAAGSSFFLTITEPEASITLPVFDDIVGEDVQELPFNIVNGELYEVDPDADGIALNIADEQGGTGVGPTVGLSASDTDLVEGEEFTVNFAVDGDIPDEGVTVLVQGTGISTLSEFDIFGIDPATDITGTNGEFPVPGEDESSFFLTITEPEASITLSVFDDGVEEGTEEVSFSLVDGEVYEVDPDASEFTLTLNDAIDDAGLFFGGTEADEFDANVSPEGFNATEDLVFAGAGDDLMDTSAGGGSNRLYGQAGNDTFFLGSNDRAFGEAGDDIFFLLGGDNVVTGGEGAEQFWLAAGEVPEAANTLTDFELGADVLGIGGLGLSFEDLTLSEENGNTLIAAGEQELARLTGINVSSLSADNFVFA